MPFYSEGVKSSAVCSFFDSLDYVRLNLLHARTVRFNLLHARTVKLVRTGPILSAFINYPIFNEFRLLNPLSIANYMRELFDLTYYMRVPLLSTYVQARY